MNDHLVKSIILVASFLLALTAHAKPRPRFLPKETRVRISILDEAKKVVKTGDRDLPVTLQLNEYTFCVFSDGDRAVKVNCYGTAEQTNIYNDKVDCNKADVKMLTVNYSEGATVYILFSCIGAPEVA